MLLTKWNKISRRGYALVLAVGLLIPGISQAALVSGLEIAGVDIVYDRQNEEYLVIEVNGLPAFATPEQEQHGIDFNSRKIEKIVEYIDHVTGSKSCQ